MKAFLKRLLVKDSWLFVLLVVFLSFLLETTVVYFLYSWCLLPLGMPEIGFWQMFGIVVLTSIIVCYVAQKFRG